MNQDMSSPSPMPSEPKKNNTTLIIIVVVLVVLCCCCAAAAGGYYFYQNGDKIFGLNSTGALLAQFL